MIKYAGIGSRETPEPICSLMGTIAKQLAIRGYILRSGHAKGADLAFEKGCDMVCGLKEIFTPKSKITQEALDLAEKFHPAWYNCDEHARKLHARNGYIILGKNLDDPVDLVICYSPGGFEYGGTSQGLRIAREYDIKILNLYNNDIVTEISEYMYGK